MCQAGGTVRTKAWTECHNYKWQARGGTGLAWHSAPTGPVVGLLKGTAGPSFIQHAMALPDLPRDSFSNFPARITLFPSCYDRLGTTSSSREHLRYLFTCTSAPRTSPCGLLNHCVAAELKVARNVSCSSPGTQTRAQR